MCCCIGRFTHAHLHPVLDALTCGFGQTLDVPKIARWLKGLVPLANPKGAPKMWNPFVSEDGP